MLLRGFFLVFFGGETTTSFKFHKLLLFKTAGRFVVYKKKATGLLVFFYYYFQNQTFGQITVTLLKGLVEGKENRNVCDYRRIIMESKEVMASKRKWNARKYSEEP